MVKGGFIMKLIMILFSWILSMKDLNGNELIVAVPDKVFFPQDVTRVHEDWDANHKIHRSLTPVIAHESSYMISFWNGTTFPIQPDYPYHPLKEKQYPMLPDGITFQHLKRRSAESSQQKSQRDKHSNINVTDEMET
jgi:hypothetical protein